MMRRALVLTDEAARHPFRASLPQRRACEREEDLAIRAWALGKSDIQGFAATYFACFAATLAFLI